MTNKIVIFQKPNAPSIIASAAFLISLLFRSGLIHQLSMIGLVVSLSAWSYLEITSGINWVRKAMGVAAIIWVILFLFTHVS